MYSSVIKRPALKRGEVAATETAHTVIGNKPSRRGIENMSVEALDVTQRGLGIIDV